MSHTQGGRTVTFSNILAPWFHRWFLAITAGEKTTMTKAIYRDGVYLGLRFQDGTVAAGGKNGS